MTPPSASTGEYAACPKCGDPHPDHLPDECRPHWQALKAQNADLSARLVALEQERDDLDMQIRIQVEEFERSCADYRRDLTEAHAEIARLKQESENAWATYGFNVRQLESALTFAQAQLQAFGQLVEKWRQQAERHKHIVSDTGYWAGISATRKDCADELAAALASAIPTGETR